MEPNEKPKLDIRRVLITAGIVLLAALVVGGTTWYVMDKSAKEVETANDKSILELQKQIDEQKKLKTPTTTQNTTAVVIPNTDNRLIYDSSLFSLKYPANWIHDEGTVFFHPVGTVIDNNNLPDTFFRFFGPGGGHGGPAACYGEGATSPTETSITYDGFRGTKGICSGSSNGTAVIFTFKEKLDSAALAQNSESGYLSLWFEFKGPIDNTLITQVMDSLNIK